MSRRDMPLPPLRLSFACVAAVLALAPGATAAQLSTYSSTSVVPLCSDSRTCTCSGWSSFGQPELVAASRQ